MLALTQPCSLHPFNQKMFVLLFLAQLHSEYDYPLARPDVYPSKTRFLVLLYSGSILYSRKNTQEDDLENQQKLSCNLDNAPRRRRRMQDHISSNP